jgi:predicted ribosomally synthesized peptide with nif11-like leader
MATAALLKFIEAVKGDDRLRAEIEALGAGGNEDVVAEVVRIAAGAGYALKPDEVAKGLAERAAVELGDEDLERVAGGVIGQCDLGFAGSGDLPRGARTLGQPSPFKNVILQIRRIGYVGPCT